MTLNFSMKFSRSKRVLLVNEALSSHGPLGNYKYRITQLVCLWRVIYSVPSVCYICAVSYNVTINKHRIINHTNSHGFPVSLNCSWLSNKKTTRSLKSSSKQIICVTAGKPIDFKSVKRVISNVIPHTPRLACNQEN